MKTIYYDVQGKIVIDGKFKTKVRINIENDTPVERQKMIRNAIYEYYRDQFKTDYIHFEVEYLTEGFVMMEFKK